MRSLTRIGLALAAVFAALVLAGCPSGNSNCPSGSTASSCNPGGGGGY